MSNVVDFTKKRIEGDPTREWIYVCSCGCADFRLYADSRIACAECKRWAANSYVEWANLPPKED